MSGPYETEAEVRREPMPLAVAAIHAARTPGNGASPRIQEIQYGYLLGVCAAAETEPGALGRQMLAWLAHREPETVQVFGDLIARAHAAGKAAATEGNE